MAPRRRRCGGAAARVLAAAVGAHAVAGARAGDVEILGTGFGRTGTSSLARAMVDMGFAKGPDIYNMRTVLSKMKDNIDMWMQISSEHAAGRPITGLFRQLFRGKIAVTDYPACAWWREIREAFPKAKVIHTHRDPEAWYDSSMNSTFPFVHFAKTNSLATFIELEAKVTNASRASWTDKDAGAPQLENIRRYAVMMQEVVWDRLFGPGVDPAEPKMRGRVVAAFSAHLHDVRQAARGLGTDFLELKVGEQDLERLCAFVGVKRCPKGGFPQANKRDEFYYASIRPVLNARLRPPAKAAGARAGPAAAEL